MGKEKRIIKALRIAGFSQSSFSRKTGICRATIWKWQKEGAKISGDHIKVLRKHRISKKAIERPWEEIE